MAPDGTAVRVALWRAMHVQVDPPPHVLDDEIGLQRRPLTTAGAAARHGPGRHQPVPGGHRCPWSVHRGSGGRAGWPRRRQSSSWAPAWSPFPSAGGDRRPPQVFEVDLARSPGLEATAPDRAGLRHPRLAALVPVDFEVAGHGAAADVAGGDHPGRAVVSQHLAPDVVAVVAWKLASAVAIAPLSNRIVTMEVSGCSPPPPSRRCCGTTAATPGTCGTSPSSSPPLAPGPGQGVGLPGAVSAAHPGTSGKPVAGRRLPDGPASGAAGLRPGDDRVLRPGPPGRAAVVAQGRAG